jgi:hypothetical protein
MELTHWQYMGALGGVIGIGWLVVVPMYRGWKPLNERVRESTTLLSTLSESEGARPGSRSSLSSSSSSSRSYGISIR